MELEIREVKDKQTENERVIIDVHADTDLRDYLIIDNTYDLNGEVSNKDRHFYSFPQTSVKAGDLVRLYTKTNSGGNSYTTQALTGGETQHTFYWGFRNGYSVWNNDRDKVTLIKVADFESKSV